MSDPDAPAFPPPPPRNADAHAYRSAAPSPMPGASSPMPGAATRTVVRRPDLPQADVPPRSAPTSEPDFLAHALGPGRMPRIIIRYPRLSGVGLVALGALGVMEIARLSAEGGVYMRALPAVTAVALFLGGWLAIVGRPADARGYSPSWWNAAYVAILAVSVVAALVVHAIWL